MPKNKKNTQTDNRSVSRPHFDVLSSPAKVNLGLRIVGRRDNGYHNIQSLFWPVTLCDQMELEPSANPRVTFEWNTSQKENLDPENNLVSKALKMIAPSPQINVRVRKNIPVGAGLGGGSSNAGTLLGHFKKNHSIIGETHLLGADVPFFMKPKPSWVEGIGEEIEALQVDPDLEKNLTFLIATPRISIATKLIFESFRNEEAPFSERIGFPLVRPISRNSLFSYLETCRNDLEPIVERLYPQIAKVIGILKISQPLYAGLSGSGACCFAVLPSENDATVKDLEARLREENCSIVVAKTYADRSGGAS